MTMRTMGLVFVLAAVAEAQEAPRLTLAEAVRMAVAQNRALKIGRAKVKEEEARQAVVRSHYFPEIKNLSTFVHTTAEQQIGIPAGAFGVLRVDGPVPSHELLIKQGQQTLVTSGTSAVQPLTPLIRVRAGHRAALAGTEAARSELRKTESDVALGVHRLYFGLLIVEAQQEAARQEQTAARERLRASEEDVRNGSALKVATLEARAEVLQSEQAVLAARLQEEDLRSELNEALGVELATRWTLAPVAEAGGAAPMEEYLAGALAQNPEILVAREKVKQARAGVAAARAAYIPDVAVFARQSYQNGVPFLVHNFGTFGVSFTYDLFDGGRKRAEVQEGRAKLTQAEENLARLTEKVKVEVERGCHQAELARHQLRVAEEVVALRTEAERLAVNQREQGVVLESARRQAEAARWQARADRLRAQLAVVLADAELARMAGRTPGL